MEQTIGFKSRRFLKLVMMTSLIVGMDPATSSARVATEQCVRLAHQRDQVDQWTITWREGCVESKYHCKMWNNECDGDRSELTCGDSAGCSEPSTDSIVSCSIATSKCRTADYACRKARQYKRQVDEIDARLVAASCR